MGQHRHDVTVRQRAATIGRRLAVISRRLARRLAVFLGHTLTYLVLVVIVALAVLGAIDLFLSSQVGCLR